MLLELESLESSKKQKSSIVAGSTSSSVQKADIRVGDDVEAENTYIEACCPAEYKEIFGGKNKIVSRTSCRQQRNAQPVLEI